MACNLISSNINYKLKENNMTAKKEKKDIAIKDDIIALAAKIEAGITLDAKSGIGTESGDLYKENLPEDLSMEVVRGVTDYNTKFIAAGAYAFGKMSVDAMAGNKGLAETSVDIAVGTKDNVSYSVQRTKEYTNHLGGGEKTVKHGVISAAYEVRSGKNGGQLKAARQTIAALAMEKLK